MIIKENYSLQAHHTFHLPIKSRWYIEYESIEELKKILKEDLLQKHSFLHIGGGSNLLFIQDYNGVILHSGIQYIDILEEKDDSILLKVGSGMIWDDFVKYCVNNNWGGTENLSMIPGEVGASAVQNIGAYGAEVKDIIENVNTIEIATGHERTFKNMDCKYNYRESVFKKELKGKYIVTSVEYRVRKNPVFNLSYGNLKEALSNYDTITLQNIREAVMTIRESKLPDPNTFGNAGSFFMNPIISLKQYKKLHEKYPDMPHYPIDDKHVKVPAGWMIDRCGWKGKEHGGAAVYDKQSLVLINKNDATPKDVIELSQQIQKSVKDTYDITIYPEVNFI